MDKHDFLDAFYIKLEALTKALAEIGTLDIEFDTVLTLNKEDYQLYTASQSVYATDKGILMSFPQGTIKIEKV